MQRKIGALFRFKRSPIAALNLNLDVFSPTLISATIADPSGLAAVVRGAEEQLRKLLPLAWVDLTTPEMIFLFASTLAHNLKPYGPGTTAHLAAMLKAETLDCSNYGLLTHYLAEACGGNVSPVISQTKCRTSNCCPKQKIALYGSAIAAANFRFGMDR